MRKALLLLLLSFSVACAPLNSANLLRNAADSGFEQTVIRTDNFDLMAAARNQPDPLLVVYIEGDGKAFVHRNQPATDPTPDNPVALRLALQEPHPNCLYLARPCQFVDSRRSCHWRFWTLSRYAPQVIEAMDQALDIRKRAHHAKRLALIGHSGGGTVALLLAARRSDVDLVVTLAGNLDHQAWTTLHDVTPLLDSLSPAELPPEQAANLAATPQVHFVGANDRVVPPAVPASYLEKTDGSPDSLRVVPDLGHEDWPAVWNRLRPSLPIEAPGP